MNKIEYALKLAKDCTYADEMTESSKEHLRNVIDEALKEVLRQPDVMRIASEVLSRLEEAEKELAYHQEWYKKARENYDKDRNFFWQADDGEMRVASDAASESQKEVSILKWVLGHP